MLMVFVSVSLVYGGAERYQDELITECLKQGDKVWVFLRKRDALESWADRIERQGGTVRRGNLWIFLIRILWEGVREGKKILHVNGNWQWANTGIFQAVVKRFGFRVIITEHSVPLEAKSEGRGIRRWAYWRIKRRWRNLRRRWEWRTADRVITVCRWQKDELIRIFGLPQAKVQVIHNGIDFDIYRPCEMLRQRYRQQLQCSEGSVVIGFVGRIEHAKGVFLLINSLADAIRQTSQSVCVAWFGEGKDAVTLQSEARQLGIGDHMRWMGWQKEMAGWLNAIDLMVLPSLIEVFPFSVLEAMGTGKPVIATDVGGIKEIIEDGNTGYLVVADNGEMLATRIQQLVEDKGLRDWMGCKARERVCFMFSSKTMYSRTIKIFEEL